MSTDESLQSLEKDDLIKIIGDLKNEINKRDEDFKKLINLRLYNLERAQNISSQYNRRESFEIVGIPTSITNDDLEDEVYRNL